MESKYAIIYKKYNFSMTLCIYVKIILKYVFRDALYIFFNFKFVYFDMRILLTFVEISCHPVCMYIVNNLCSCLMVRLIPKLIMTDIVCIFAGLWMCFSLFAS